MGVFCVPGNNDYEAVKGNYPLWERMLGDGGTVLLCNRRAYLRVPGGRLVLSGLDESKYGRRMAGWSASRWRRGMYTW